MASDERFESLVKAVAALFADAAVAGYSLKEIYSAATMRLGSDPRLAGPVSKVTGVGASRGISDRDNPASRLRADEELVRRLGHTPEEVTIAMQSKDVDDYARRIAAKGAA